MKCYDFFEKLIIVYIDENDMCMVIVFEKLGKEFGVFKVLSK